MNELGNLISAVQCGNVKKFEELTGTELNRHCQQQDDQEHIGFGLAEHFLKLFLHVSALLTSCGPESLFPSGRR